MLLFLDTEFTDFQDCDLISLGLVSEDGHFEFYAERSDFDYESCSDFVRSKVWAQLGRFPCSKMKQAELAARLSAWFAALPEAVTFAFDSERDITLLMGALGAEPRPKVLGHVDLRPLLATSCVQRHLKRFYTKTRPPHHALFDAQAHRSAWLACSCSGVVPSLVKPPARPAGVDGGRL